jgi:NADPH:quinone reductase-like Zn-dependent oxidoreductase
MRYNHVNIYRLKESQLGDPSDKQVLVKMLAAPINPADINLIEGTYGVRATLPAIGGSEGVGIVEKAGSAVKGLKVGDHVIPSKPCFGMLIRVVSKVENGSSNNTTQHNTTPRI